MKEIDRERAKLPVYERSDDPGVHLLKRVIPFYYRSTLDRDMIASKNCNRDLMLMLGIYNDKSVGGLRDTIEAALLTGDADVNFFEEFVCRGLDKQRIELYRYLFYDIEADRERPFWVHRNIFMPNKEIGNNHKFDSSYMWKVVAYHGGTEKWMEYALDGKALTQELTMWFRDLGVSEHIKNVLKSIHSNAKLIDSAGTPAAQMTSTWHKDATKPDDDATSDSEALAEVHSALEAAIARPDESHNNQIQAIAARKFEDKE